MSKTIDQRVVEMQFDNANFERNVSTSMSTLEKLKKSLRFEDSAKGFESIAKAAGSVDMGGLGSGVESVRMKFSALEVMAVSALQNITNKAVDAGTQLVKSLSIDQMIDGWTKFEDKTSAVQTIMSATGLSIDEVNTQLAKLNWFTDETSYNFTDMTDNIGKFTSQGVDLETATVAMEGIATWAAKSGQGAASASRAMYNLSQALGVGAVKLQDWMSIENANMATAEFKQLAIDIAKELGTLSEAADVTVTNFRENLKDGWFTSDVLIKVLNQYGGFADELYKVSEQTGLSATDLLTHLEEFQAGTLDISSVAQDAALSAEELTEIFSRLGDETMSLGNTSFRAAQEAKTFTDMLNATKDAVSTGWMNTDALPQTSRRSRFV